MNFVVVVIIRLMVAMVQVLVDSSSSYCSVLLDSSHYQFFLGSYTATSSQQGEWNVLDPLLERCYIVPLLNEFY